MALILRQLLKSYHYLNNEISDPRTANFPLIGTPFPMLAIIVLYVYLVKELGPSLMKDRPPFKLDRTIQFYNVVQIILSLAIAERTLYVHWGASLTCQPVDYSTNPQAVYTAKVMYFYFLVKIVDLIDTVFFVLRKKNNQVSFLHVYHHGLMVFAFWIGVKYVPGGHGMYVPLINGMVHAVMYSYYLLTSIYPEQKKNIWWKKHITQIQIVQFLLLVVSWGELLVQPGCDYPVAIPLFVTPQVVFMLILFLDFYRKAYTKEKMQQAQNKVK